MERCLPSVMAQTYKDIEVIIVAHNCTDDTVDRVINYNESVRWMVDIVELDKPTTFPDTPENRWFAGPVDPLNLALKLCTGDWIARVDDDDEWVPEHLEECLKFAMEGNHEFVSAGHVTHEGEVGPYILEDPDDRAHLAAVGGTQTWVYRSYLKMFRYNPDCWRKSWDRVNDTDIQQRMFNAGVRMGYLPKCHAKVYPRPGQSEVGLKAYQQKG